jgi:hypothetical protein
MPETRDAEQEVADELRALAPWLDRIEAPAPAPELVERTLRLAAAELSRAPALTPGVAAAAERLPAGFRRELARLLAAALPALALALAWTALVGAEGTAWLGAWLPAWLAAALVAAHVVGALGWLGLASASLPLVAHRRATLRLRGAHP